MLPSCGKNPFQRHLLAFLLSLYSCVLSTCFSLSCVLCPKAGSVDDGATGSGLQLFSSTPGNWSSCPLAPWVGPTSFFLIFLVSVFLPFSLLVQSSADSHVLGHVLSSWLDVAGWRAPDSVVLSPDSRLLHLTRVLSSWFSPSCARSKILFLYDLFYKERERLIVWMNDDVDITECATNNGGCNLHATCTNTIGSYTCNCLAGYTGDGKVCHGKSQQFSIGMYRGWPDIRPFFLIRFRLRFRPKWYQVPDISAG